MIPSLPLSLSLALARLNPIVNPSSLSIQPQHINDVILILEQLISSLKKYEADNKDNKDSDVSSRSRSEEIDVLRGVCHKVLPPLLQTLLLLIEAGRASISKAQAVDERLLCLLLDTCASIQTASAYISLNINLPSNLVDYFPWTSHLLAPLVHASLQLLANPGKTIQESCMRLLLALSTGLSSAIVWRNILPGTFSALVRTATDARTNRLASRAVLCLLNITRTVLRDSDPLNAPLLPPPVDASLLHPSLSTEEAAYVSALMHKLRPVQLQPPSSLSWRNDVIAKIRRALPSAVRQVLTRSSPSSTRSMLLSLADLICAAHTVMGAELVLELLILLGAGLISSSGEVSAAADECVAACRTKLGAGWTDYAGPLLGKLKDALDSVYSAAGQRNETLLDVPLREALAAAALLRGQSLAALEYGGGDARLVRSFAVAMRLDELCLHASVMTTRTYAWTGRTTAESGRTTVECGLYRCAAVLRSEETSRLARSLLLLLSRSSLVEAAAELAGKVRRDRGAMLAEAVTGVCTEAGAWAVLGHLVVGLAQHNSYPSYDPDEVLCGGEGGGVTREQGALLTRVAAIATGAVRRFLRTPPRLGRPDRSAEESDQDDEASYRLRAGRGMAAAGAIEVMSSIAFAMGTQFRSCLRSVLYVLMEAAVDTDPVKLAATTTLTRIALYCNYDSRDSLIASNADYIVDNVCSYLRNGSINGSLASYNARTPLVVAMLLKTCGGNRAPFVLLRDAVLDSLLSIDRLAAMGILPDNRVADLLSVLSVLVVHLSPAVEIAEECQDEYILSSHIAASLGSFAQSARLLVKQDEYEEDVSESRDDNTDSIENQEDENDNDDDKDEDPSLSIIADILDRCGYFLSHTRLGLAAQRVVVQCICDGLARLAVHRRRFLPIVHKMWTPLLNRLLESTATFTLDSSAGSLLIIPLLHVCQLLCRLCGDFIAFKMSESLWPRVIVPLLRQFNFTSSSSSCSLEVSATAEQKLTMNLGKSSNFNKIKLALLLFLESSTKSSSLVHLVKREAFSTSWLLLPFLHSENEEEIRLVASRVLTTLSSLSVKVTTLLQAVLQRNAGIWRCFCADPLLVLAFHGEEASADKYGVPISDYLLSRLNNDNEVTRLIKTVLASVSSEEGRGWRSSLVSWAVCT